MHVRVPARFDCVASIKRFSLLVRPSGQHGAATLLLTMVLLLGTAVTVLYAQRHLVFEQRMAAAQVRSAIAFETAQAGLEWATGMLNTPNGINAACQYLVGNGTSFRRAYLQAHWNDPLVPPQSFALAAAPVAACSVDTGAWLCDCPAAQPTGAASTAPAAALSERQRPAFSVAFAPTSDPEAVLATVTACSEQNGPCTPETSAAADATATVSEILKLQPQLRALPDAPLTCGTSCSLTGAYRLQNLDPATNGILLHAGAGIVTGPDTTYISLPGQPTGSALIANDVSLKTLSGKDPDCSANAVFAAYFASSLGGYASASGTKVLPNCRGTDCDHQFDSAYAQGWRAFFFPDGFERTQDGPLGSALDPVLLVTTGDVTLHGATDAYGLLFINAAHVLGHGTGNLHVRGAMITCAGLQVQGRGTLEYDRAVLQRLRSTTGAMVRVPGSWSDRCAASSNTTAVSCN